MPNPSSPRWIADFTARHHRPPRILHFGNICNNAYQIAKMLRAAGAECDVLSVDYYHIMGAPEWEDADFTGDYGDVDFPRWHKVDLHGFERPRWFAAAPRALGTAYLLALRQGEAARAKWLWRKMERTRRYLAFRQGSRLKAALCAAEKAADILRMTARYLCKSPQLFFLKWRRLFGRLDEDGQERMRQLEGTAAAVARAKRDFAEAFPGRAVSFGWQLDDLAAEALTYRTLFSHYDLIHAYSADPIWPYLAGAPRYVAYENGTLRYLPQQTDERSLLLMLAYAKASAVMLTNTDCCESAAAITETTRAPLVYALHGLDTRRMLGQMDLARQNKGFSPRFGVPRDTPLFFCPSRHTWDAAQGVFLKGEDIALRAAQRLAAEGFRFCLVMTGWGGDTPAIRRMIDGMPALAPLVRWIAPIEKMELHQAFLHVDAVLDQFYLPVFGAITFEVLCASRALLLSKKVTEERMRRFFRRQLPYCACDGEDDIYRAMRWVLTAPEEAGALAAQGRQWVRECHSAGMIVEKCGAAYQYAADDAGGNA